jgi:hypothetical protein
VQHACLHCTLKARGANGERVVVKWLLDDLGPMERHRAIFAACLFKEACMHAHLQMRPRPLDPLHQRPGLHAHAYRPLRTAWPQKRS